jgi:hypothetical protein
VSVSAAIPTRRHFRPVAAAAVQVSNGWPTRNAFAAFAAAVVVAEVAWPTKTTLSDRAGCALSLSAASLTGIGPLARSPESVSTG